MNSDIRISVDFWQHPKTVKLERSLGLEAVKALTILWMWCARNRPDGDLTGLDVEDIEIAADWRGEAGALFKAMLALRWIDEVDGQYRIHDWHEHNSWAAEADERSDVARFSRLSQVNKDACEELKRRGVNSLSKEEYLQWKKYRKGDAVAIASDVPGDSPANAGDVPANRRRSPANAPAPSPSPAPAPSPVPKDKEQKQDPLIPPEGEPDVADSESEAPDLVLESPPLKSSQTSEGKRKKKKDMTPEELDAHMQSIRPMEGVPFDQLAWHVMLECIPYVPCYAPYPGADTRLVQELGQEYPHVNLAAEFRRARDWLRKAALESPGKIPKSDFHRFLRNWVSNAVTKYGAGQPRVIGFETETIFVPAKDEPGGGGNAG